MKTEICPNAALSQVVFNRDSRCVQTNDTGNLADAIMNKSLIDPKLDPKFFEEKKSVGIHFQEETL